MAPEMMSGSFRAIGDAQGSGTGKTRRFSRLRGWAASVGLFVFLVFIYEVNDRELGTFDTHAAAVVPYTLLRGDGVYLDRLEPALHDQQTGKLLPFVARRRGHLLP